MKYLKLLIPIVIILIIIAAAGTIKVLLPKADETSNDGITLSQVNFSGCKVEVLEHGIYGGGVLGELNKEDTEYFISIMKAIDLGQKVEDYQLADGESAKEYLITLSNGQKIYFGQGFGEATGYEGACFVHINDDVYTVTNPAVLNALYVIKENLYFYTR